MSNQVQGEVYAGAGANGRCSNVLSRGEGASLPLSVMIPRRRKRPAGAGEMKCIFCDCESCLCRFLGILGCEYAFVSDNTDLIAVFRKCVAQYAKNSTCASGMKVSWTDAQCELLIHPTPGSYTISTKVKCTGYTGT